MRRFLWLLLDWHQVANFRGYNAWDSNTVDTALDCVLVFWGERLIERWTNTIDQTVSALRVTHTLAFY